MTQPSRLLDSGTHTTNESGQDMQQLPALDLVKPAADSIRMNIEIAREWAFLGGD